MAKMGFIMVEDTLSTGLAELGPAVHHRLETYFKYNEDVVGGYMKETAPWTDRTGNARQGLFAQSVPAPGMYQLFLCHSVPYGIWLEVRWSGKYAVIIPSVRHEGNRMMAGIGDILSGPV